MIAQLVVQGENTRMKFSVVFPRYPYDKAPSAWPLQLQYVTDSEKPKQRME